LNRVKKDAQARWNVPLDQMVLVEQQLVGMLKFLTLSLSAMVAAVVQHPTRTARRLLVERAKIFIFYTMVCFLLKRAVKLWIQKVWAVSSSSICKYRLRDEIRRPRQTNWSIII